MSVNFPASLDTFTNPNSTDTLSSPSHSGQHSDLNNAVEALEAKVGADGSEVTSSLDYKVGALEDALPTGDIVGTTDTQTLTNKTLTSPVINTGVSGTAILDEDNMASNSATKLATQQSIKAYVDAGKVGASYNGFPGGDTTTTTSTSPVQVGSAQFSITTKGGNLFVSASALMKVNTLTGSLGIQIDGITVVECITNSTSYVSLCPQYVKTSLPAGSHTIKLVFWVQSGSTATIPAYNTYSLSAVEL